MSSNNNNNNTLRPASRRAARRPPNYTPPGVYVPPDLRRYWDRLYEGLPEGRNPVIPRGDLGMIAPYVHTNVGRTVLASYEARDVEFRYGRIQAYQIASHRPSYINALLIQSLGSRPPEACISCRTSQAGPFPECHHLPGAFDGACANCKWPDAGSRCSIRDSAWGAVRPANPPTPIIGRGSPAPGARTNPILLGFEEEEEEVVLVPARRPPPIKEEDIEEIPVITIPDEIIEID
ncbi:DUF3716 domain-containing protein [Aspergillus saccharolyticus JOP 1030-1]|uniref:Uncharacterized protein n=1 Tax=Aspergillus saccharolyticus JOP 1030-1 TaxID=1450539 RepID=A0A318ZRP6_9EURO|nr:hypothetical protein BP01DRAFT_362289 [Aspergillus saccharolyticus JOP 1030-1]PYH49355.1 hypothetical protein BP01DRAFT_362289 [Aspergillus saccharolyticus JOP 1030-1]